MNKSPVIFFFLVLVTSLCCKKPYNPQLVSSSKNYLVVEGVINSGTDSTTIKLSKTVNLDGKTTLNPVLGAVVNVESDQNASIRLIDAHNNGNYSSPALGLSNSHQYRLRIATADGNQYLSDFMTVKPTPPIDSVGFKIQNGSLVVYVNAHDAANNTHFYRWDYSETWLFHSKYGSDFQLDTHTNTIVPRTKPIFYCFGSDSSSNVVLTSTAKLSHDVVYQSPVTTIPVTSERLGVRYSILIHQYALTSEAYNFYQNIQKNTEQLGSIFDSQPTQLIGNIHSIKDPAEAVIGYLTITNVQSKRIFIGSDVLPKNTITRYPFDCEQDTALYFNKQGYNEVQNTLINPPVAYLPTEGLFTPSGTIYGYLYSSPQCVDCTIRGTIKVPPFWK